MYKLYKTSLGQDGVLRTNADGSVSSFLCEPDNKDYQEYLAWVEAGNTPEPADE